MSFIVGVKPSTVSNSFSVKKICFGISNPLSFKLFPTDLISSKTAVFNVSSLHNSDKFDSSAFSIFFSFANFIKTSGSTTPTATRQSFKESP